METVIKVDPSELDLELLNKIKAFIGSKKNIDVTISLKEYDVHYLESINESMKQADRASDLISFTMEEFIKYIPAENK